MTALLIVIVMILTSIAAVQASPDYLPLRVVFEANGAQVHWVDRQIVVVLLNGDEIIFTPDSLSATINNEGFHLDFPVIVAGGTSLISTSDATRILVGEEEFALTTATAIASTEALMEATGVVGLTMAIVDAETGFTWTQGFGFADSIQGRPVDEFTLFQIASISKPFTAIAVMQLVEEGLINLDSPVVNYLPEFSIRPSTALGGDSNDITVRMLLNNTSGITSNYFYGFLVAGEENYPDSMNNMLEWLQTRELSFPAGATWEYANAGWTILGILVANVMGYENYFEGFVNYTNENIFARIGMETSSFEFPQGFSNIAMPYTIDGEQYVIFNSGSAGAGAMLSNAYEMARFMHVFLSGGVTESGEQLLLPETIAYMVQDHTSDVLPVDGAVSYGLGFIITRGFGFEAVGHNGLLETYISEMVFDLETGLGVFVSSNSVLSATFVSHLAHTVLATAITEKTGVSPIPHIDTPEQQLVPLDMDAVPVELTEEEFAHWVEFLGLYDWAAAGIWELQLIDGLFVWTIAGTEIYLTPMSDGTFDSFIGRYSFEFVDGDAVATINHDGIVTSGVRLVIIDDITTPEDLAEWIGDYNFVPQFENDLPLLSVVSIFMSNITGEPTASITQRTGTSSWPFVEVNGRWFIAGLNYPILFGIDEDGNAYIDLFGAIFVRD